MSNQNTSLSIFDFKESPVRVLLREGGQPFFLAADVCRVLEIANSRAAVASLDDDEKATVDNPDSRPGQPGAKTFNIVSESGLYALIFKSRKPMAKAFRRWVTGTVLPQIRQTGSFQTAPAPERPPMETALDQARSAVDRLLNGTISVEAAKAVLNLTQECRRAYALTLKAAPKVRQLAPAPERSSLRCRSVNDGEALLRTVADRLDGSDLIGISALYRCAHSSGLFRSISTGGPLTTQRAQRLGKALYPLLGEEFRRSDGRPFRVLKHRNSSGVLYAFELLNQPAK